MATDKPKSQDPIIEDLLKDKKVPKAPDEPDRAIIDELADDGRTATIAITFSSRGLDVQFGGIWSRGMLDQVNIAMRRKLQEYNLTKIAEEAQSKAQSREERTQ